VSELGLRNVGGIFLVLGAGVVIGGLVAAVEHFYGRCKKKLTAY